MADTAHTPGEASELFALAEQRHPSGLQLLCIRPDPSADLVEALTRRSVIQGLVLDDSPARAVAFNELVATIPAGRIDILCADIFTTRSYEGRVPADVIVLGTCLTAADEAPLRILIEALPRLCSRDALVMWRLEPLGPERLMSLRRMLDRAGFESDTPGPDATWHHAHHVGVPVHLEGRRR